LDCGGKRSATPLSDQAPLFAKKLDLPIVANVVESAKTKKTFSPDDAKELLREIARSLELTIYAGAINREHVHMLLSIPPYLSVSRAVQFLKGKSSQKLLSEYPSLRKRYWGQHLWARGYFVATTGNVTDEVIAKYIESQDVEPQKADDFKISE